MKQYAILLDSRFCTGCNTCFYKCVQENRLHDVAANGNTRTLVKINDEGMYHHRCMHCIEPTCVANCPKKALTKTDYGPVLWDTNVCIRCGTCVQKCPFHVPMLDQPNNQIVKCSMCAHRNLGQDENAIPACVTVCPTGALEFGERGAMVAKAKQMAKDGGLNLYGLEENGGTNMLILTKADPTAVGYPAVQKSSAGMSPVAIGGTAVGVAAIAAAAYAGLKKYSTRRNEIAKED
ncbi:MAG TPA: hypothetical protein DER60_07450 [Syntrophomonas sp.]|jgi:formate dehydrogenase iron-sulfur subunit|nr:hypothetical protein [Syntrophomonas sp.]